MKSDSITLTMLVLAASVRLGPPSALADDHEALPPPSALRDCEGNCDDRRAGYDWAHTEGIDSKSDCRGDSDRFIAGCEEYATERAHEADAAAASGEGLLARGLFDGVLFDDGEDEILNESPGY